MTLFAGRAANQSLLGMKEESEKIQVAKNKEMKIIKTQGSADLGPDIKKKQKEVFIVDI